MKKQTVYNNNTSKTMKKIALSFVLGCAFIGSMMAENTSENLESNEQTETVAVATFSLQGSVYDPVCNEAISGATIVIDGKKYYSDLSGNFDVPALSKGKHLVSVDFVSYQNKVVEIDLADNQNLEIHLKQQ